MIEVPFTDLGAQYRSIRAEIDSTIHEGLASAQFIGGAAVATFEAQFAGYVGALFCVGVGNGTDALEIALRALELPSGGEVIVPANSFIGSSEAVTNAGLSVRFCDVDTSYTLDPEKVSDAINSRTVAIMPVHLYGQPADMDALLQLADKHDLRVIEDCAQAHGAEFRGQRVGTFGDAAAFSFFPGKNLGAYGDGGAIVTSNERLEERSRMIANHGRIEKYAHLMEGRNSRLDALQARVLSVKLKYIEGWTSRRRDVADMYFRGLAGIDPSRLVLPAGSAHSRSAYHLFVVRHRDRDALAHHLRDVGIATGVHYPCALPDLPAYSLEHQSDCPHASEWAHQVLSLPIGEHMSDEQVAWVIDAVREYLQ